MQSRSALQGSRIYRTCSCASEAWMLSSPCAFTGIHLSEQPFRYYLPHSSSLSFSFPCPCLSLIKVPAQTLTWIGLRTKGDPCANVHPFLHYVTVLFPHVSSRTHFYSSFSVPPLLCPFFFFAFDNISVQFCGLAKSRGKLSSSAL